VRFALSDLVHLSGILVPDAEHERWLYEGGQHEDWQYEDWKYENWKYENMKEVEEMQRENSLISNVDSHDGSNLCFVEAPGKNNLQRQF